MKIGDKLIASWSEVYLDKTTQGKEYEVVDITEVGFWIINDDGEKVFPVSTEFKKAI
ncbi:hypothetical protein AAXE64_07845 [Priestia megaterium]